MVLYRERDNERPPLSLILPHLFLGAESDVTQDCLSARGISYVLSVSRCSPQPTFLPLSQYLRIPIDDSLRDDLLCWIPEALRFIDGAVSSGGSVLVHCAAGISRSPALAVAYIMYSLGMDLDHAYRFVKERRPSISPNFNFLGQLQHFQGTLSQKTPHSSTLPLTTLDKHLQPASKNTNLFSPSQNGNYLGSCGPNDFAAVEKVYGEKNEETGTFSGNSKQELRSPSPQTLSLSGKLRTLTLALNQNQREVQGSFSAATPSALEPATPLPKPTQLHLPTSYNSLSEKRKSLTLSLTPLGSFPPTNQQKISPCNSNHSARHQSACNGNSKTIHKGEMGTEREARRHSNKPLVGVDSEVEGKQKEVGSANVKSAQPAHSSSRNREGRARGKRNTKCAQSARRSETERDRSRETADNQSCCSPSQSGGAVVVDQQPAPESKLALPAAEAKESLAEEQGVLSPLNLTVNKLLGWGERMLLGVLLGPRIKVGQAALPYRC